MRIFKPFMAVTMFTLCSMNVLAQTSNYSQTDSDAEAQELGYNPYPYGFVQVQGGLGSTFTDVSFMKLLTPTFSIAVGDMFTPIVGARLHVNGYQSKGGFDAMGQYYEGLTVADPSNGSWQLTGDPMKYNFKYINTNADLMINLINIFSKKVRHPLDLYLIGGIGLNYAWGNDDFDNLTARYNVANNTSNAWGDQQATRKNLLSHNVRVGLLADYNISKNWSIGAEVDFNSLSDRFNSKYNNSDDWMATVQVSLTYKFGFKKYVKPVPEAVSATPVYQDTKQAEVASAPAPTPAVAEKPAVVEEPIKETIFYAIRESDLDREDIVNKIVEWCKKYPNKTITINGYADKGTGNKKLNAKYAKLRAEKLATALQNKGVPASQMTVSSHGDTVQPFDDNDKNRCVIIEGK